MSFKCKNVYIHLTYNIITMYVKQNHIKLWRSAKFKMKVLYELCIAIFKCFLWFSLIFLPKVSDVPPGKVTGITSHKIWGRQTVCTADWQTGAMGVKFLPQGNNSSGEHQTRDYRCLAHHHSNRPQTLWSYLINLIRWFSVCFIRVILPINPY